LIITAIKQVELAFGLGPESMTGSFDKLEEAKNLQQAFRTSVPLELVLIIDTNLLLYH